MTAPARPDPFARSPNMSTTSTLQRGQPVDKRGRAGQTTGSKQQSQQDVPERGRQRGSNGPRQAPSTSPGKENHPFPTEGRAVVAEQKAQKTSIFRSLSPERKAGPRGRSVSPFKRDKDKGKRKTSDDEKQSSRAPATTSRTARQVDDDFVAMLAEMEVPTTIRMKLMTMDLKVKESMMKGQATLSTASLFEGSSAKVRPGLGEYMKKSKSSTSVATDSDWEHLDRVLSPPDRAALFGGTGGGSGPQTRNPSAASCMSAPASDERTVGSSRCGSSSGSSSKNSSTNKRSSQISGAPAAMGAHIPLSETRSRTSSFSTLGYGAASNAVSATAFATMLKTTDSSRLDVAKMKKMRAILSSESPAWIGDFVEEGGYTAMLTRLKELLDLEWREEQHDDQLLHELLRCFVGLSTTDRGLMALQSCAPAPFVGLAELLFSEKRPGDLSTRKLLVELLIILASLPTRMQAQDLAPVKTARVTSTSSSALYTSGTAVPLPAAAPANFLLLFSLLHNLRDPTEEAKVDFITASHAPRPFKTFVSEFLNINRDYFWVFCHANRFWSLKTINVDEVEGPKVPGGMTGGVEFEAMGYLTSLFRLLNTTCSQLQHFARMRDNQSIAHDFHALLFSSGFDRALAVTRKASQEFYQTLHLEMARYFDHARRAGYRMPLELEAWQSVPQLLPMRRDDEADRRPSSATAHSPTKRSSADERTGREAGNTGHTGKWLGGGRRECASPLTTEPSKDSFEAAMSAAFGGANSRSVVPHATEEKPATTQPRQASERQASMVGTAVKRWEQRTGSTDGVAGNDAPIAKQQTGLGLGWAPPR